MTSQYETRSFSPGQAALATDWLNLTAPEGNEGLAVAVGTGASGRFVITKRLEPVGRVQEVAELRIDTEIDEFLQGAELLVMGAGGMATVVVKGIPTEIEAEVLDSPHAIDPDTQARSKKSDAAVVTDKKGVDKKAAKKKADDKPETPTEKKRRVVKKDVMAVRKEVT